MKEDVYQQLIRAALAQHQHWLYRASSGVAADSSSLVDGLGKQVAQVIYDSLPELTALEQQALLRGKYTTAGLRQFRSAVNKAVGEFSSGLAELLEHTGVELAGHESSYAVALLSAVAKDIKNPDLNKQDVYDHAVSDNPVMGRIYTDWLDDIESGVRGKIFQGVRNGVSSGDTTDAIVRSIRGTKAANYKDGLLNTTRREAETIARTTRTHISNMAYEQTYAALDVEYVMVCATLDGRTSLYCATHDGVRYKIGSKYPAPPYHPNCRTVLMPDVANGEFELRPSNTAFKSIGKMTPEERESVEFSQVSGKNYAQWFESQSDEFQREWLGKTRYELYKEDKYSLDRFTDPTGRTYNIEELRERDEKTFKELGL